MFREASPEFDAKWPASPTLHSKASAIRAGPDASRRQLPPDVRRLLYKIIASDAIRGRRIV